jgi:hypothetical protein
MACFQKGGTGVTPVKSGVAPDFAGGYGTRLIGQIWSRRADHNGFERDARNGRPEARATTNASRQNFYLPPAAASP